MPWVAFKNKKSSRKQWILLKFVFISKKGPWLTPPNKKIKEIRIFKNGWSLKIKRLTFQQSECPRIGKPEWTVVYK